MTELYWRPFDTVPGDLDVEILLWFPDLNRAVIGSAFRYNNGSPGFVAMAKGFKPSHWMPMPSAPLTHSGEAA